MQSISPILYKLEKDRRTINQVSFKPSFNECIYFVYLNKKQNSFSEIKDIIRIKHLFQY